MPIFNGKLGVDACRPEGTAAVRYRLKADESLGEELIAVNYLVAVSLPASGAHVQTDG